MSRIWLVGMMGTGKSTAGRIAADHLGVSFTDTDTMIEVGEGRSVQAIWEEEGEQAFRKRETRVLSDLSGFRGLVSTGGGVVLEPSNRTLLAGKVVWLVSRPETMASRLGNGSDRPLLTDADDLVGRLAGILEERAPLYAEVATHLLVTDDLELDEVAAGIVGIWRE